MASGGGIVYALNRTTDTGALLSASKREGITDLMAFVLARRASQVSRLLDVQQSEVSQIEIGGRKAFRFDVSGSLKTGQKFTYLMTIIEGTTEIAILNSWTTTPNFDQQREAMGRLSDSVVGL